MSVAYAVLVGALLLTAVAYHYINESIRTTEQARFDETVQRTQQAVDRRINTYMDAMFGTRGLFAASEQVGRTEFREYVESLDLQRRYPGIQSIGYAERIEADELAAHEDRVRSEGLEDYRVDLRQTGSTTAGESADEATDESEQYFPITYMESRDEASSEAFLGRDLRSLAADAGVLDQARDSNLPRASGKFTLTDSTGTSFAIYIPIYENGEPRSTVTERREALAGYVISVFQADEVLEDIFLQQGDPTVDFEVYDGAEFDESYKIYDRAPATDMFAEFAGPGDWGTPDFYQTSTLQIGGRLWILRFATLPSFESGQQAGLPLLVLQAGFVLSLVLFGLTYMLARSRTQSDRARNELQEANRELESFSYTVSHDLRAPLRSINGFSRILQEDHTERLDEEGRDYLGRINAASRQMGLLIDDLLDFSRLRNRELRHDRVELSRIAREVRDQLTERQTGREVEFIVAPDVTARGDAALLRLALENLLGNAFKFTGGKPRATIEFGLVPDALQRTYFVRDDGAGFEMAYREKLWGAFQRLHRSSEFEGTGIGLATVRRIVERHGGEVWATGEVGRGATFYFTLGEPAPKPTTKKREGWRPWRKR